MERILFFILALLLFACNREKETAVFSLEPPIVTGYLFIDANGNPTQIVGTPNTKTSEKTEKGEFEIVLYPNPSPISINIIMTLPAKQAKITAWVVAAQQDPSLNNFNFIQASVPVIGGRQLVKTEVSTAQGRYIDLELNIRKLPAGAYRVYVQTGDVLLWDNLLKIN